MWLLDNFLRKRSHTHKHTQTQTHTLDAIVKLVISATWKGTTCDRGRPSLSFPSNQASWALELINKNLPTRRGHTSTDLCPDRCCRSHGWKVEATFQQDRTLLTFEKSLASTGYLLRISWPRMGWTWSWCPSGLNGFRQASDISYAIYLFIPTYSHVKKST